MADEFSIAGFAAFLGEAAIAQHEMKKSALENGARIIEKEAKRVIGTYDYGWSQLAPSTQADRARQGFAPNEPLLRTGELRDSIEHTVHAEKGEADIGSNSDIAVWQELGTSTIPARPFLAGAAAKKGHQVAEVMGREMLQEVFGWNSRYIYGAGKAGRLPKP